MPWRYKMESTKPACHSYIVFSNLPMVSILGYSSIEPIDVVFE